MNFVPRFRRSQILNDIKRVFARVRSLPARSVAWSLRLVGRSRVALPATDPWSEIRDQYFEDPLPIDLQGRSPGNVQIIAFFLPQFHRDEVNENAWGRGFTEWRNVTKALPLFRDHRQPKLPADLGFYDLTMVEAWIEQARLTSQYGIQGFALYHYWFPGARPLEASIKTLLDHPDIPLSFCLCWANESWTRRWDGGNEEVILRQDYEGSSPEDLAGYLLPFMLDKRYICEDGKPIYLIYRADELPSPADFLGRLRDRLRSHGIELCLGRVLSFRANPQDSLSPLFDFAVQFPVHGTHGQHESCLAMLPPREISDPLGLASTHVLDYQRWSLVQARCYQGLLADSQDGIPVFPAVMPDFDNTARRGNRGGSLFLHASGMHFHKWVVDVLHMVRRINFVGQRQYIRRPYLFITSWNEWAEGSFMEPSLHRGYHYLNSLYRACVAADPEREEMIRASRLGFKQKHLDALIYHLYYPEATPEVAVSLKKLSNSYDVFISVSPLISSIHLRQIASACSGGGALVISQFENCGYDIYPFFAYICDSSLDLLHRYRWILKLHAKRSSHRADGSQWSHALHCELSSINPGQLAADVGLVASEMSMLRVADYIGSNAPELQVLLDILSLSSGDLNLSYFPAGSMYLIRADCLAYFEKELPRVLGLLKDKAGYQIDGSYAHAIERCIQMMVYRSGFFMCSSGSLL
ncbi:glycoside hydrolase family 99-like domain-containing protein [Cyanobium sp. Aljojuca 7D2]|uniref:glycoside hydrolase family 99-like domain-containing protein n=1 Tax=Cyanobium sp. Aljojuca 7D2 TaxID=2823698 RepID=UPI0020CF4DB3|nr:glycoside hydrolase family 99-like domain-containing protein [Cyanobium sp. Aljojuca 7D2]MCP9890238.1 glycoside hydrolase family 99-like domain-containing protein [Cyanobium sp. Aljojuca 7D2]